ncbi:MAG: PaaI family thioesterase [Asticcacaulis sp.]
MPFSDLFAQIIDNTPYMKAIGAVFDGADEDGVQMRLPWRADLAGDADTGVIAPGVVTALLDNGCGMAVWHSLDRFKPIATLDLRIDYMRPAGPGLDLRVTASCYKLTRSIGFARAFVWDLDPADPVAAAQGAFIIASPTLDLQTLKRANAG